MESDSDDVMIIDVVDFQVKPTDEYGVPSKNVLVKTEVYDDDHEDVKPPKIVANEKDSEEVIPEPNVCEVISEAIMENETK